MLMINARKIGKGSSPYSLQQSKHVEVEYDASHHGVME